VEQGVKTHHEAAVDTIHELRRVAVWVQHQRDTTQYAGAQGTHGLFHCSPAGQVAIAKGQG